MTTRVFLSWIQIAIYLMAACSQEKSVEQHDHSKHVTETESKSRDLMLTDSQIALANIQTQKAGIQAVSEPRIVNARVVQNSDFTNVISSRVAGRVERLFIKETGKQIIEGQPLYEIYSENLLTLQHEFLLAHAQAKEMDTDRYKSFETAARKKLILYGLTEAQIDNLASTGIKEPRLTFLAPAFGIVKSVAVQEGQTVAEGDQLYEIENLKKLRVEAELFADEAGLVTIGDKLRVKVDGYELINMEVKFINPEFKSGTQIWLMWGDINNPGGLTPGMQAQIWIDQKSTKSIAVPVHAVIRSEDGTHLYVETDKNTFQPRLVKTGLENFSEVEILEGLQAGETVVVSGAYLIYSEYILKHGVNPAHAHN
ncbi:MAG: efflux RND transporter periplasmic adaptor subunit [Cyclobacteriaceae bacterium]|nr:efflux RND transporter periplasmic adaptor subunit [Cyclobacteriaceae bacterium]